MWSAVGAIGGSLLGGLTSLFGQNSTNKTNLKIARETNAQNYQMFKENQAYNSAASQKARLEAAGLNPNLAYGEGSALGGMQSVDPTATTGAPMQNAYEGLGSAISSAANNLAQFRVSQAQAENIQADTEGKKIENDVKADTLNANLGEIQSRINLNNANAGLSEGQRNKVNSETALLDKDLASYDTRLDKVISETRKLNADAALAEIDAFSRSEKNKAEIEALLQKAGLDSAQSRSLLEQLPFIATGEHWKIELAKQQAWLTYEEGKGVRFENSQNIKYDDLIKSLGVAGQILDPIIRILQLIFGSKIRK